LGISYHILCLGLKCYTVRHTVDAHIARNQNSQSLWLVLIYSAIAHSV